MAKGKTKGSSSTPKATKKKDKKAKKKTTTATHEEATTTTKEEEEEAMTTTTDETSPEPESEPTPTTKEHAEEEEEKEKEEREEEEEEEEEEEPEEWETKEIPEPATITMEAPVPSREEQASHLSPEKFVWALSSVVGLRAAVHLRDGAVFEGVLHAIVPPEPGEVGLEVVLRMATRGGASKGSATPLIAFRAVDVVQVVATGIDEAGLQQKPVHHHHRHHQHQP
jgi:hypothetical protein